jgi:hypothetical protein
LTLLDPLSHQLYNAQQIQETNQKIETFHLIELETFSTIKLRNTHQTEKTQLNEIRVLPLQQMLIEQRNCKANSIEMAPKKT